MPEGLKNMLISIYNLHWTIRGLVISLIIFTVYSFLRSLYKEFTAGIIKNYEEEKKEYDSDCYKIESNRDQTKRVIITFIVILLISFLIINKWEIKKKDFYEEAYQKALYLISDEVFEHEKGLLYLDIAIKTDNPSLKRDAYYQIGYCNDTLGDYIKAVEAYKQSISIIPDDTLDDSNTYSYLGSAYDSLGLYQEAIEAYRQSISMDSFPTGSNYIYIGDDYVKLGFYQEAIEAYKQAIQIYSDGPFTHYLLGYAYLLDGDKNSALNEYNILKEPKEVYDIDLANKLFDLINNK